MAAPPSTTGAIEEEGLSAYERLRLVKIARNKARLESLGLATKAPLRNRLKSCSNKPRKRKAKATATATTIVDRNGNSRQHQQLGRSSERLKKNKNAQAHHQTASLVADVELGNAKDWMNKHSFGDHKVKKKNNIKSSSSSGKIRAATSKTTTRLPKTSAAEALTLDDLRDYERDAFSALREWKRARGRELGYSNPCVICHNRTLVEMCRYVPDDEQSLLRVWGISLPRLEQHGELMLEALGPWRKQLREGHAKHDNNNNNNNNRGQ